MVVAPRRRPLPIAFATVLGLCVFFVVTNTACWALWYPRTLAGLVTCYVAAIPFFKNTVLGDSLYTAGLFAARPSRAPRPRPLRAGSRRAFPGNLIQTNTPD